MRVKYLGESDPLALLNGKEYDVLKVEDHGSAGVWYRIIDETEDDYIYPAGAFEIVSDSEPDISHDASVVLNLLNDEQFRFIDAELDISKGAISRMSDKEVAEMYDKICDIEVAETAASENKGEEYSERGLLAEDIVTLIGNELYAIGEETPNETESA